LKPPDLRTFVAALREAGELLVIEREVDPDLEIAALADRASRSQDGGNKALLFTNVKDSEFPVLINAFGSEARMNLVWAPGARVVELMGDFVDWLPVPLIRQPNGEWRGYYHITPGLHRVNIRIDGTDIDAPVNWPVDKDEFLGSVALVLVR
jgi:hypothetical protein